MGVFIKLIPPKLFSRISIFEEQTIKEDEMDNTLTSRLRRKSTVRIGHSLASQRSLSKS